MSNYVRVETVFPVIASGLDVDDLCLLFLWDSNSDETTVAVVGGRASQKLVHDARDQLGQATGLICSDPSRVHMQTR